MNANMENTIYGKLPVVAGLNKVQDFDPCKFMRRVISDQTKQEAFYLDLKFKKLWFRLACPKGRIKTTALKITEQLAIIEAKVYFDRSDKEPAASFIAQRNAKDTPGALYIETAQYAAVDQALIDAGFGLQFADIGLAADATPLDEGIPVAAINVTPEIAKTAPPVQSVVSVREAPTQAAVQTVPVRETTVVQETQTLAASQPTTPAADVPLVQAVVTEQPTEELMNSGTMGAAFTGDMPVEELYHLMTVEDAENYIVDVGTCKGWTLGQVAQRRAASLKWYLTGYQGDNNILRAGARILLEQVQTQMAS